MLRALTVPAPPDAPPPTGAQVIVNVGHIPGQDALEKVVSATLRAVFPVVVLDPVTTGNSLVVAGTRPIVRSDARLAPPLRPLADKVSARLAPALTGGSVYTDDRAPVGEGVAGPPGLPPQPVRGGEHPQADQDEREAEQREASEERPETARGVVAGPGARRGHGDPEEGEGGERDAEQDNGDGRPGEPARPRLADPEQPLALAQLGPDAGVQVVRQAAVA